MTFAAGSSGESTLAGDTWSRARSGTRSARTATTSATEVELPRVTFHDLGHACATPHVGRGSALSKLMLILGHAGPKTTLGLYAHADAAMMQGAVEALGAVRIAPK